MNSTRRPALGRGLSALIPDAASVDTLPREPTGVEYLPLSAILPARKQPRLRFDDHKITALSESIKEDGILQPLVVRKVGEATYEIIAGERRFRAATLAELDSVPVVIRDAAPDRAFLLALVENLQREDLDPLEEAEAFRTLIEEHDHTHEQVGQRVGRDRATVTNTLRLLQLPNDIRTLVASGALTPGHGRALLSAPEAHRIDLAQRALDESWSVRKTERMARHAKDESNGTTDPTRRPSSPGQTGVVEAQLRAALGAPVRLHQKNGKGRIEVRFHSLAELERLIELISHYEGR